MTDSEGGLIDRRLRSANVHDPFAPPEPVVLKPTGAQVEIWLSSQQPEASPAYNEAFAIRLRGAYDQPALEAALRLLPQFHEALRGRFSADGERFTMDPAIELPIARHDLSNRAFGEREAELAQFVKREATTPYDVQRGPLVRATLIRLDPNECVLLLGAYHGVCDGWSLDVLLMDLGRLYSAFTGKLPLPTPPRHSFRDFVAYTETPEYLANVARSRAFWLDMFKQHPPPLMLPADGTRPEFRSYGATHVLQKTGPELQAALTNLARANGLSFFSVVFSAFAVLLHRISGATDLVIGIPVAGHPEAGMEDCVGHLVNMVPVRCAIDPKQSFLHLCRSSSERLLDARENASVGFSEIVSSLNLPRDAGRIPLVAAVFTHVQKYAPGKLVFGDCEVSYDLIPRGSEAFEFNLNVIESHESLNFHSYANQDLYSQNWLTLRLREFQQLLESAVADPWTPVGKLAIVPPPEAALVESYNATRVEYPRDLTLFQLFEAQAARSPHAVAVHQGEERVTYEQLAARADRLARVLRRRGVSVGTLVGLCVERTPDMIAAVLAVLKAGGAYIPLDPAFPPGRLAFMVEDSALTLVVSESALAELHGAPRERVLELDSDRAEIDAEPAEGPFPDGASAGPSDPAYVLYTSGSTGKPKGVRVHHRAAVNFITSMQREPGLTSADKLLAVTTLSFDIALLELMLPLSVGAEIILATRDESRDPRSLRSLIDEHGVTLLQATPATWRMLIDSGWQGSNGFRALCGGEAMQLDLAEALLQRTGELWNMYGPTETTVWSTCSRVSNPRAGITIGRPIANTTVRILDAQGEVCPIGVPGEIYIGGDGVALGYLNRPDLTAERFIQDPFSNDPEARLYKTGDLGRWRNDGQLDCLGRNDFQVKIRGYRIELGEIESTIVEHGWLKEAAVVPRQAPSGEMQLVAYGIVAPGRTGEASELWDYVGQRLPSYMVPSALMLLESFPLTPNGKLDRKALPEPRTEPSVLAEKVAPRTPIEESLGAVFREVLKLEQVGIDDNFFELGGTSLHTIHVVDRLNKRGISVPPAHMFRFPTIRRLAAEVGARHATDGEEESLGSVLVLQQGGSRPPLFLLHSMPGDLLGYGDLVHSLGPDQPVYGFHGLGSYSENIQDITDLAELYATRLMAFKPTGMLHLAGWCFGGTVAFELARVLTARGREVGFVGLLEATPTRSRLRSRAHLLKVVVTRQTVAPVSVRALLERVLKRPTEDPEGTAFALEVTSGPFANRARNYARNRQAAARHRTRPYAGDVALVRAGVDKRVIVEHDYGWADFARDVDVYTAQATHQSVLRLPHCTEIAQFIRDSIDRAERKKE